MTTREALLAAVIAAPDDDLPRLVYADHLEENGEHERAEFIRAQIELAKWPVSHSVEICAEGSGRVNSPDDLRFADLMQSSQRLFYHHNEDWFPDIHTAIDWRATTAAKPSALIRRGFVSCIHCTTADWFGADCVRCRGMGEGMQRDGGRLRVTRCPSCNGNCRVGGLGPQLVRQHPIAGVVFDRETRSPVRPVGGGDYVVGGIPGNESAANGELPFSAVGFLKLSGGRYSGTSFVTVLFDSEQEAKLAVSSAAIMWAKSQPV